MIKLFIFTFKSNSHMNRQGSNRKYIAWATILFSFAMLPPLLSLFNRPIFAGGLPLLFGYVFIVWLIFIVFTAIKTRKTDN
jgi:hypothetical protein